MLDTRDDETETLPVYPDTAKILGISRQAAFNGVKAGEIPSIRIGRRILVPRRQLIRMLEGRATA